MKAMLSKDDIEFLLVTYKSEKRNAMLTPTGSDVSGDYHDGIAEGISLVLDLIKDKVID